MTIGHRATTGTRVAEALADGWRFAGLHATATAPVRTLLVDGHGEPAARDARVADGAVPSIVDLAPAAGWDEREAHDLYGVAFDGHEPLRPLVDHDLRLDRWTVPVRGHDAYQVAVGPIHAGVIESGHFRFHVVGDRILHLDARLFYKHRGLERAAEGQPLDGVAYAARACAPAPSPTRVAYAQACEDALGLAPTPSSPAPARSCSSSSASGTTSTTSRPICAGVGLAAGNSHFAALTERARRLNAALTGHRFLFGTVRVGGSDLDARPGRRARRAPSSRRCAASRDAAGASCVQRLLPGPAPGRRRPRRATTRAASARSARPRAPRSRRGRPQPRRPSLAYDGFEPVVPPARQRRRPGAARAARARALADLRTPGPLLDGPLGPAAAAPRRASAPIGVGRVESPRGATTCIVERDGDRIERLRLRTGSYANWPSVAHAATDNLLPDFPLINKSFELCYACADR